jgi:hypothetical protein
MPVAVRASSARDVHDVADLEDVAAVESAGRGDAMHVVAERRTPSALRRWSQAGGSAYPVAK